ncbi:unnamed protein product [Cylicocyclus nassatus]|uniref:SCP domain-containing protein n=1 Tax=Cylicocyclus nassatus TaxID=53992 RepID=A0AA36DNP9_CYLNA|nr:unnamed protein product [Cylicocyclus nassatus]
MAAKPYNSSFDPMRLLLGVLVITLVLSTVAEDNAKTASPGPNEPVIPGTGAPELLTGMPDHKGEWMTEWEWGTGVWHGGVSLEPGKYSGEPLGPEGISGAPIGPEGFSGEPIGPEGFSGEPLGPGGISGKPVSPGKISGKLEEGGETVTMHGPVTTGPPEVLGMCPNSDMEDDFRVKIVAAHNKLRGQLANGTVCNGPGGDACIKLRKANKMMQVKYNCDSEKTARAILPSSPPSTCDFSDFQGNLYKTAGDVAFGPLIEQATVEWWSQIYARKIDQTQNLYYTHLGIAKFALMASDLTTEIGCAHFKCGADSYLACSYKTELANAKKLYNMGPTCKQCPEGLESCVDSLCPVKQLEPPTKPPEVLKPTCPDNAEVQEAFRRAIWGVHNEHRAVLALGGTRNGKRRIPDILLMRKANQMGELKYNCELEMKALERARQGPAQADNSEGLVENVFVWDKKKIPKWDKLARRAASMWWSEILRRETPFDQVQNIFYTHLGITSFAMMASDLTTELGCAHFPTEGNIVVVCHYQTTLKHATKLYNMGPTCKKCPLGIDSCVNGLCPTIIPPKPPEPVLVSSCPSNTEMPEKFRRAIWLKHNEHRAVLALGAASNGHVRVPDIKLMRKANQMSELRYNCALETQALVKAKLCEENPTPEQNLNAFMFVPKPARKHQPTIEKIGRRAVSKWWSELKKLNTPFDQTQNLYYDHSGIPSFAKIASDLTTEVGCAYATCGSNTNVVCLYTTTLASAKKLYNNGPTCNKCAGGVGVCMNGLCPVNVTITVEIA